MASAEKAFSTDGSAGQPMSLKLKQRFVTAYLSVHHSGGGPGLLLIGDKPEFDEGLIARADLFGQEGYSVMLVGNDLEADEIVTATAELRNQEASESGLGCIAYGTGAGLAIDAAEQAGFDALVIFDLESSGAYLRDNHPQSILNVPCPFVIHFGTADSPESAAIAAELKSVCKRKDGSRVFDWPEGAPGFSIPFRESFSRRADDLAHTRTLDLLRRILGPHYDFVDLFAQHLYHEFETRDVDATMETMIDEPYVNHVPTLAGGVGHDMLKRFYKYHFVDQNSASLDRARISFTSGSDRLVLESYTKFCHDAVIDRYFPDIEPTGKIVELALVIVVKFRGDKVCHEHIYWDQGSALKQIGVLDTGNLPVAGAEAARKVLDETQPSNIFMQHAWATSEDKPL